MEFKSKTMYKYINMGWTIDDSVQDSKFTSDDLLNIK